MLSLRIFPCFLLVTSVSYWTSLSFLPQRSRQSFALEVFALEASKTVGGSFLAPGSIALQANVATLLSALMHGHHQGARCWYEHPAGFQVCESKFLRNLSSSYILRHGNGGRKDTKMQTMQGHRRTVPYGEEAK